MEKIDKQLKRIEECESAGMWEFAAYFRADNRGTSETAASIYRSLISGEQTCLEHSAINTWDIASSEDLLLKEYLLKFRHPRFCYSGFDYDASRQVMISPAAMTSTRLSSWLTRTLPLIRLSVRRPSMKKRPMP